MPSARLADLNDKAEDPELWSKPERAQKIMRERNQLEQAINPTSASSARSPTTSS